MTTEQMPPLPPYFYGAETGDLEKCWMERDMHAYARAYAAQEVARERARHIVKLERHEFEATDLLRRFVANLPKQRHTAYWATVRDASGLGSTCAAALAEWAGRNAETGARNA